MEGTKVTFIPHIIVNSPLLREQCRYIDLPTPCYARLSGMVVIYVKEGRRQEVHLECEVVKVLRASDMDMIGEVVRERLHGVTARDMRAAIGM